MNLHTDRIMPVIQKEYKEYLKKHADEHRAANSDSDEDGASMDTNEKVPAPDTWWKFACARARVMLDNEPDDIKKGVEEHRKKTISTGGLELFVDEEGTDVAVDVEDLAKTARNIQR